MLYTFFARVLLFSGIIIIPASNAIGHLAFPPRLPPLRGPHPYSPTFLNNVGLGINHILAEYPDAELYSVFLQSAGKRVADQKLALQSCFNVIQITMIDKNNEGIRIVSNTSHWGAWDPPEPMDDFHTEWTAAIMRPFDWSDLHDLNVGIVGALELALAHSLGEKGALGSKLRLVSVDPNFRTSATIGFPKPHSEDLGEQIAFEFYGEFHFTYKIGDEEQIRDKWQGLMCTVGAESRTVVPRLM